MASIEWVRKESSGLNSSRAACVVGEVEVGSVSWRTGTRNDDGKRQGAYCDLPGIKNYLDVYSGEDEAKARVERAVKYWLKKCGIELEGK